MRAAITLSPDRRAAAARHIVRAAFVRTIASIERIQPEEVAAAKFPGDKALAAVLRAPVTVGNVGSGGDFEDLAAQRPIAAFIGSLGPLSAAAALIEASGLPILAATASPRNIPIRTGGPVAPGFVAEGDPIAVRGNAMETVQIGPPRKIAAIFTGTRESFKRADAEAVFAVALREDAAAGFDAAVFSEADGNGDEIAGLLHQATEVTGSGDPLRDLRALAASVSAGGSGRVVYVAGPGTAAALAVDATIRATIVPSISVPESRLVGVDPMSIAWGADDESYDIEIARAATLHMETSPEANLGGSGDATPVRSLFQTDSLATRLLMPIAFVKRRAACVAFIDSVDYLS